MAPTECSLSACLLACMHDCLLACLLTCLLDFLLACLLVACCLLLAACCLLLVACCLLPVACCLLLAACCLLLAVCCLAHAEGVFVAGWVLVGVQRGPWEASWASFGGALGSKWVQFGVSRGLGRRSGAFWARLGGQMRRLGCRRERFGSNWARRGVYLVPF